LENRGIFVRVVLQIRILDNHVGQGGRGDPCSEGGPFALVDSVSGRSDRDGEGWERGHPFRCVVGGGIINDNNLSNQGLIGDSSDDVHDGGGLVKNGDDYG